MPQEKNWYEDHDEILDVFRIDGAESRVTVHIPGYEDFHELRRGGQGIVYLAVQTSTKRQVAIKVIREGVFASISARTRFRREIELVSQMRHPNIVRIYDSGEMADGCPYSIMEYIEGRPLDEYVALRGRRGRAVATDEKLRLFAKICDAVHYANQRGVVHRDLKPSNIRVDALGEPHVLDFGLAKNISRCESHGNTEVGHFVGALPWASPEQAKGFPDGVDIRTDVYSLGVILFQILTRRYPYDVSGSTPDVLNRIISAEPTRPGAIDRRIDSELDTIILKSLAKEPDRRYQSVGELAADVRHYLAGEPIAARRDSTIYVLRKNLRKYRWAVSVAAAFIVLLCASSVVAWTLYSQSEQRASELRLKRYYDQIRITYEDYKQNNMRPMAAALAECPESLRGWEWGYLNRLAHLPVTTMRGHATEITSLSISPDGKHVASCSADSTMRIWDTRTGEQLYCCRGHTGIVSCVAFVDGGRRVITGGSEGELRLWDASSGECVKVLRSPYGVIGAMAVNREGSIVLLGYSSGVIVWTDSGLEDPHMLYRGGEEHVQTLALSNDGKRFVAGDLKRLRIWDFDEGQCAMRGEFDVDAADSRVCAASIDNTCFVSGGTRHSCEIRTWETGEVLAKLPDPIGRPNALAASPDGHWIAVGGMDGSIRVWDAEKLGEPIVLRGHFGAVGAVAFSPTGGVVSGSADRKIHVWHNPIGECDSYGTPVRTIPALATLSRQIVLTSDGCLAQACHDLLQLWDYRTGDILLSEHIPHLGSTALAITRDHQYVALGKTQHFLSSGEEYGEVIFVCLRDMRIVWRSGELGEPIKFLAFSNDDHKLAVSRGWTDRDDTKSRSVDIRNVKTGELEQRIEAGAGGCWEVEFDPTGQKLLGAGEDGIIRIWDVADGRCLVKATGHDGPVMSATFSNDGQVIASGGEDSTVRVWDAASGRQLLHLEGHNGIVYCVSFHPDGSRVVSSSSDGTLRVWDVRHQVRGGRELLLLKRPSGSAYYVAFADQGSSLISTAADGSIVIHETIRDSKPAEKQSANANANWLFDQQYDNSDFDVDWISRMIANIEADTAPPHVKAVFPRVAELRGRDASRLEHSAWVIAEVQGREKEAYQRAANMARRACEIAPENVEYLHTRGVAEYRAGYYEDALASLAETTRQRGAPHDHAFMAMVLQRLGRNKEAADHLKRAKQRARLKKYELEGHLPRFIQEADRLLNQGGN